MLTREQAEAVLLQAAEYPEHDQAARAELRAIAERKHQQEAAGFREFAAIDQQAYAGRIAGSVSRATADLEAAEAGVRAAEVKAGEAIEAERAAEDRARDHAEHARQAQEAWKAIQGRGTPREQTEALTASQAAAQVAAGEQAAAEGKAAARAQAGRDLEAARAKVTEAEAALRATRDLAASPGRALYSPQTIAENLPHVLRIWDSLQPVEQQLARNVVSMYAVLTGVADDFKAKGAAERDAELEAKRPQPGAFTVPGAVPGIAGR